MKGSDTQSVFTVVPIRAIVFQDGKGDSALSKTMKYKFKKKEE